MHRVVFVLWLALELYLVRIPQWSEFYYNGLAFFSGMVAQSPRRNFTILLHSSEKTKHRLNHFLKMYYRPVPGVNYLVVYPRDANPDPRIPSLITTCASMRDTINGLHCRDQYVYEYFLNNTWMGDFLYRAMDDTILNVYNMIRYIDQLRQVYDPYNEVVFRTSMNQGPKRKGGHSIIGGGAGWLQSRAMVAVHTLPSMSMLDMYSARFVWQDDMTQTRIYQRLNMSEEEVTEMRFGDDCHEFCNGIRWMGNGFRGAPTCRKGEDIFPMNEAISFHSGFHKPVVQAFGKWIGHYPPELYGYISFGSRGFHPCTPETLEPSEKLTLSYMRRTARHMSFEEAKKRVAFTAPLYQDFLENLTKVPRYSYNMIQPAFTYEFQP